MSFDCSIKSLPFTYIPQAMNDILREMAAKARIYLKDDFLDQTKDGFLESGGHGTALVMSLTAWAEKSDKPLRLYPAALLFPPIGHPMRYSGY